MVDRRNLSPQAIHRRSRTRIRRYRPRPLRDSRPAQGLQRLCHRHLPQPLPLATSAGDHPPDPRAGHRRMVSPETHRRDRRLRTPQPPGPGERTPRHRTRHPLRPTSQRLKRDLHLSLGQLSRPRLRETQRQSLTSLSRHGRLDKPHAVRHRERKNPHPLQRRQRERHPSGQSPQLGPDRTGFL